MATLNIEDLDFSGFQMGEEGELEAVTNTPEADATRADKKVETPAMPEVTGATADGDVKAGTPVVTPELNPAGTIVDWEKRYKDLQADHTRKAQELSSTSNLLIALGAEVQTLKDIVAGKQTPSTEQSEEDLLDALADRERAPGVLKKLIQDGVSQALQSTPEARIQREFDETSARIGTDFTVQLPVIKQLSSELAALNVNFTFDQLYALSKLVPKAEQATQTKPEATASKPLAGGLTGEEAAALAAKASALKTESGVSANPEAKPKVNSVRSAMNAALEELGYA